MPKSNPKLNKGTLQPPPGKQSEMSPQPQSQGPGLGANKLKNKTALISGGDSGIGRAVAVAFAKEGANVCVVYLSEDDDAETTKKMVEEQGQKCLLFSGDVGNPETCHKAARACVNEFGGLDILVNNAGEQHPQEKIEDISKEQLEKTFRT